MAIYSTKRTNAALPYPCYSNLKSVSVNDLSCLKHYRSARVGPPTPMKFPRCTTHAHTHTNCQVLKLPSLYSSLGLLFFYCFFFFFFFLFSHSIAFDRFLFPLLTLKTANGGCFRRFSYENGKALHFLRWPLDSFCFFFTTWMAFDHLFPLFQSSTQWPTTIFPFGRSHATRGNYLIQERIGFHLTFGHY